MSRAMIITTKSSTIVNAAYLEAMPPAMLQRSIEPTERPEELGNAGVDWGI